VDVSRGEDAGDHAVYRAVANMEKLSGCIKHGEILDQLGTLVFSEGLYSVEFQTSS
jgi:hypothetical protein